MIIDNNIMPPSIPLVTVIIPTYNRAHLIHKAIECVIQQTYQNVEIVIVDDGSTDNTWQVVAAYGTTVHYIYQENQGPAAARNRGIREATGELIAFLDSDDWFAPEKLSKQVNYLLAHPTIALICSSYEVIDEVRDVSWKVQANQFRDSAYLSLLWRCMSGPITMPTVMVRRTVFEYVAPFDVTMHLAEDIDLWCRIAREFPIASLQESLSYVRVHTHSLTQHIAPQVKLDAWQMVLRKAFRDPFKIPLFFKRRLFSRLYYAAAVNAAYARMPTSMLLFMLQSLYCWPIPEYLIEDVWKYLTNPNKWRKLFKHIKSNHA